MNARRGGWRTLSDVERAWSLERFDESSDEGSWGVARTISIRKTDKKERIKEGRQYLRR
jgi:hypothetical protein